MSNLANIWMIYGDLRSDRIEVYCSCCGKKFNENDTVFAFDPRKKYTPAKSFCYLCCFNLGISSDSEGRQISKKKLLAAIPEQ